MAAKERLKRIENNPMTVEALENFSGIDNRVIETDGIDLG